MYKEAKIFVMFSLVVMIILGYGVHAYLLAEQPPVGGPVLTSHPVDGDYEGSCTVCHGAQQTWHLETFALFSSDDCMSCHGGAPNTPHGTEDNFAFCLGCHSDIVDGHDEMFTFPNRSYDNCLICHPAN